MEGACLSPCSGVEWSVCPSLWCCSLRLGSASARGVFGLLSQTLLLGSLNCFWNLASDPLRQLLSLWSLALGSTCFSNLDPQG